MCVTAQHKGVEMEQYMLEGHIAKYKTVLLSSSARMKLFLSAINTSETFHIYLSIYIFILQLQLDHLT